MLIGLGDQDGQVVMKLDEDRLIRRGDGHTVEKEVDARPILGACLFVSIQEHQDESEWKTLTRQYVAFGESGFCLPVLQGLCSAAGAE